MKPPSSLLDVPPPNKVCKKWSCKTEAAKKLVQGMRNGDIDPNLPPKTIWRSDSDYLDYELPSFRAFLNREKAKLGSFLAPAGRVNSRKCMQTIFI